MPGPPSIDPFHFRVARIALDVARRHGFALGGGLALVLHGVLDRPTVDIDLFSDVEGSVPQAAQAVRAALAADGIDVVVEDDGSELGAAVYGLDGQIIEMTAFRDDADETGVGLSLGHLGRARSPVVLDVGPVMDVEDLTAWKVAALVARVEPRDLVDVGAFLSRRTPGELLAMGRGVDPGMEDEDIAAAGRRLDELPDRLFARYGLDPAAVAELRRRFTDWPRA